MNRTFLIISTRFPTFNQRDFYVWFNVKLASILASFTPQMLMIATSSVNCTTYHVVVSGLARVFPDIPLHRQRGITDALLDYLTSSASVINKPEDLICAAVNRSQLQQALAIDNSSSVLCNFTITQHACSLATNLTQNKLATLLKCSLESQTTYPVEVWKLFFQRTSPALDRALETFTTTVPNNSSPALSNALEALGEVKLANFSQAQLQNEDFISNWFQKTIRPFLSSPSTNFLFCLSTKNFSCLTYQIVVKEFSNQRPFMDSNRQQTVFTHLIQPFLSRNDSSALAI
ncbi:uncharacterized protein LOC133462172 [Cololabis saira]|uniref:uncharacterized protein LOC133462172 n=1 Tax=Cololabis saira TaxID=129043 RepID=UPI002AD4220D|nr:uncharacterized protein LOC133462172 [Cololabis saira]